MRIKILENKTKNEWTWNIFAESFRFAVFASLIFVIYCVISFLTGRGYPQIIFNNPGVSPGWCEHPDRVQKWSPGSSSYSKVVNTWQYPKISELYFQKIPWKITDLKRNFVILEIINSISSLKNDGITFVFLIKLWMIHAMSMKSIR